MFMFPPYDRALNAPAAPLLPLLRVTAPGRAYLHRSLTAALDLRPAQPADLVPPVPGSPYWHLDLRPAAARRISWYRDQRPRIDRLALPPGLVEPDEPLALYLLPGPPATPGYYPLLPAAALVGAYDSFLAHAAQAARTTP